MTFFKRTCWIFLFVISFFLVSFFFTFIAGNNNHVFVPSTTPSCSTDSIDQVFPFATEYDFGIVPQDNNTLSHSFLFQNDSDLPITLSISRTGCYCTEATCPDSLPPHAIAKVDVSIRKGNREGSFSTHATLTTSHPRYPSVNFVLRCYIQPTIDIDPPLLLFHDVVHGQICKGKLRISVSDLEASSLGIPQLTSNHPSIEVFPPDAEPLFNGLNRITRHPYVFHFTVNTASLSKQAEFHLADALLLKFPSDPTKRARPIPLDLTFLHHPFLSGATSVTLMPNPQSACATVRIWSRQREKFQVAKITSSSNIFVAHALTSSPSLFQDISIELAPAGMKSTTPFFNGFVDVFTTSSSHEPYRIDIFVFP